MDFDGLLREIAEEAEARRERLAAMSFDEGRLIHEAHQKLVDAAAALSRANIAQQSVWTGHRGEPRRYVPRNLPGLSGPGPRRWRHAQYIDPKSSKQTRAWLLDGSVALLNDGTLLSTHRVVVGEWGYRNRDSEIDLCACRAAIPVSCPEAAMLLEAGIAERHPPHLQWATTDSDTGAPVHGTEFAEWLEAAVRRLGRQST